MSVCLNCQKEISDTERRIKFEGELAWTASPLPESSFEERVLAGAFEFCCIRCLGTFIGVTLQSRGLVPPKA